MLRGECPLLEESLLRENVKKIINRETEGVPLRYNQIRRNLIKQAKLEWLKKTDNQNFW